MKISDLRITGLSGGTVEGGWVDDLKPDLLLDRLHPAHVGEADLRPFDGDVRRGGRRLPTGFLPPILVNLGFERSGWRIVEPAADLAVAAALVSALSDTPVPPDTVVFGEIALSGRVRPVAHADARLKEAAKLGFTAAWVPIRPASRGTRSGQSGAGQSGAGQSGEGLATVPIGHLSELVARLMPAPRPRVDRSGARRALVLP